MTNHTIQFSKGRGALSNPVSRFDAHRRDALHPLEMEWPGDDDALANEAPRRKTTVTPRQARSIISRNLSPDIGFDQSINPYQGCEPVSYTHLTLPTIYSV